MNDNIKNARNYIAQLEDEFEYLLNVANVGNIRRSGIIDKINKLYNTLNEIEKQLEEKPKEIIIEVPVKEEKPKKGRPKKKGEE